MQHTNTDGTTNVSANANANTNANTNREVGGIRLETSSTFFGSEKPITGLVLLVYAWTTEGYGFIEFEISNGTISTVFHQPLTNTNADTNTATDTSADANSNSAC